MTRTGIVYNLILVGVVIGAYMGQYGRSKWVSALGRFIAFSAMFFPAAIRYGIGSDYDSYVFYFERPDVAQRHLEVGYLFLQTFVSEHWGNAQILFAIIAFFTYSTICIITPKKNVFIVFLFYVLTLYFFSYSGIRQALAIAFCLCGTIKLLEGKDRYFFIWCGIACFFHFSAIVVLLLYFLVYIRLQRWHLIIGLFFLTIAVFYGNLLEDIVNSSIFKESAYGGYIDNEFFKETEIGSGLGILMKMLIPLLGIINYKTLTRNNSKDIFLVNMCVVYIFAYMLATQIHIFNRLVVTYDFIPLLTLAHLQHVRNRWKKVYLYGIIFLFFINFQRAWMTNDINKEGGLGISPYTTIFDKSR